MLLMQLLKTEQLGILDIKFTAIWPILWFPFQIHIWTINFPVTQGACAKPKLLSSSVMLNKLLQDVAITNELVRVVNILGPKWTEMLKPDLQPWFWLTVVMDDSSLLHILKLGIVLVAQAKHVPMRINRMDMAFKCNQCRW